MAAVPWHNWGRKGFAWSAFRECQIVVYNVKLRAKRPVAISLGHAGYADAPRLVQQSTRQRQRGGKPRLVAENGSRIEGCNSSCLPKPVGFSHQSDWERGLLGGVSKPPSNVLAIPPSGDAYWSTLVLITRP